jgi:Icc-related predicted phosphoesterase
MRILAIGDFHGRFSAKLKKLISKYEYDVIISPGDFCGDKHIKLFFKHAYGKDIELWEVLGSKEYIKIMKQGEKEGELVISYLKNLNKPFFIVTGNHDHAGHRDVGMVREKFPPKGFDDKMTLKFLNKLKVPVLDFAKKQFQEFDLIGYPRSTYPGIVLKHMLKKKKYGKKFYKQVPIDYANFQKKLDKLFTDPSKTIFVSHNVPYRTTLDKIGPKGHKLARGKHYGSALTKELIKTHQPRLVIAGHMHENPGKIRIGKTVVVNPGAAMDGRAALITLTDKQVKVKFLKA